jgi:hypothetical protein
MTAAFRVPRGPVRLAAVPAAVAVAVMLGFCGWTLALPAAIALAVGTRGWAGCASRCLTGPRRGASRPPQSWSPTGLGKFWLPR